METSEASDANTSVSSEKPAVDLIFTLEGEENAPFLNVYDF